MATSSYPQAGPSRPHLPRLEPALPPQRSHVRPPPPTIADRIQDDDDDVVKDVDALAADEPEESCLICLTSPIIDRSILPNCSHSLFCFRCILTWIQVSSASYKGKARQGSPGGAAGEGDEEECRWGRCPLCNRGIGRYILHAVRRGRRGDVNWERWWLRRGEHTSGYGREDEEVQRAARRSILEERRRRRSRQDGATPRNSSRDTTEKQADLDFARQITQRRQIYSHGRYAKHLGSNPTTGLGPPPSPSAIRAKPHLLSSALSSFLRRELLALPLWSTPSSSSNSSSSSTSTPDPTMTATSTALDVPFLTTYLLSLLQHLDVRSEGFVKLLGEVLGDGLRERQLAEHFSHELGVFLRMGARGNVKRFDAVVAYDIDGEKEAERVNGTRERRARDEGRAGSKRQRESSREQTSRYGPARGPSLSPRPQITAPEEGGQAFPPKSVSLSPSPSSSPPSASPPPAPDREEIISKRSLLLQRLAAASAEQRERALKEQLRVAVKAKGTAKGLDGSEAAAKPVDEGGDSIDEEKKEEHRAAAAVVDGGSTSSNQQREVELRRSLVEARANKAKAKGTLAAAGLAG